MLFNKFAKYVVKNKDMSVIDAYNNFLMQVSGAERDFISQNFMIMIKIGESARNAHTEIQHCF